MTEREQRLIMLCFNETIGRLDGLLQAIERLNDEEHTHETIDFRIQEERERLTEIRNHLRDLNETFQQLDETEFN